MPSVLRTRFCFVSQNSSGTVNSSDTVVVNGNKWPDPGVSCITDLSPSLIIHFNAILWQLDNGIANVFFFFLYCFPEMWQALVAGNWRCKFSFGTLDVRSSVKLKRWPLSHKCRGFGFDAKLSVQVNFRGNHTFLHTEGVEESYVTILHKNPIANRLLN